MKERNVVLILVMVLAVTCAVQAQVITSVVRANGASGGQPLPTQAGGLTDGNLVFSDRDYDWGATDTGTLGSLNTPIIGSEYIRTYNDDKNSGGANVTYTVTTSTLATVWVTVDDRIDGGNGQARADAITAAIGAAGTFTDTGLQLHVHGDSTDPGRPLSVYAADLPPGDHVFGASQGSNFYVIGAVPADPTFNPPPSVDAGPDQSGYDPEDLPFQLDGTMSDLGPSDGTSEGSPGGIASFYWTQESGPGTATFSPDTTTEDPTVTFDVPGVYDLLLQANDGFKDGNDIVTITVRDHGDDILIGHWEMEDNLLDTSVNSNHGTHIEDAGPNPPATYTDGAIGRALLLVNPDRDDPNSEFVYLGDAPEMDIQTVPPEFTVSAWFKTTNGNDQVIIQKGGDDTPGIRWMLMIDSSGTRFVTDDNNDKEDPRGPRDDSDGIWHHAVGVSDTWGLRVYVDGVQTAEDERGSSDYDISGSSQRPGLIGAGTSVNHTEPYQVNNKIFDGEIDDVRLYNYALPLSDPTYLDLLELTAMGEIKAIVDAGPDDSHQLQPGQTADTAATVVDHGLPGPLNYQWETVSKPADSNAIFTDDTALNTSVSFPDFGVYVLRVTVFDVNHGSTDSSEVTLTIVSPDCSDVVAEGLLLAGDISGPDGVPDCRSDMYDLAEFAEHFGRCNDPQVAECENPWL